MQQHVCVFCTQLLAEGLICQKHAHCLEYHCKLPLLCRRIDHTVAMYPGNSDLAIHCCLLNSPPEYNIVMIMIMQIKRMLPECAHSECWASPTNVTLDALLLLAVWQDNTQRWWIRCKLEVAEGARPSYHGSTHTPWPYLATSVILLLRDMYYTIQPQKDRMWTSFSLELSPQWKWHRSLAYKQTIIMHEFLPLCILLYATCFSNTL